MASISNPSPAVKLTKQGAYTQTYITAAKSHVKSELSTSLVITLITEVAAIANAQNEAINELKKLVNSLIDDLQAVEIVG